MSVKKGDLVLFKDFRIYKFLELNPGTPLIVIRGPYEGRSSFEKGTLTSLSIVVDLMAGTKIIEKIKVIELERIR